MSLVEVDNALVRRVARQVHNQFRQDVELDDLTQTLYLWWCMNHRRAERYRADGDEGKLVKALQQEGRAYCLAERAERAKYSTTDLRFYGAEELKVLLTAVYDSEAWTSPPAGDGETRSTADPAEGGTYLAGLVDVDLAISRLDSSDRVLLYQLFGEQWTEQQVADGEGVSQSAISQRLTRALARLQRELGGEPVDFTWDRRRRAMPRAEALAILEGQ